MKTKELTKTALMAALICSATYFLKIVPTPNGYAHLGDCMIFLSVLILGRKNASLAAGIGAGLADILGGYMQWVLPTFIIKFLMAFIMGTIIEKLNIKNVWIIGTILGGMVQVVLYVTASIFLVDFSYAMSTIPQEIMQVGSGIIIAVLLVGAFEKGDLINRLKGI